MPLTPPSDDLSQKKGHPDWIAGMAEVQGGTHPTGCAAGHLKGGVRGADQLSDSVASADIQATGASARRITVTLRRWPAREPGSDPSPD